jgi:CO/xanthine dehydrogenase FAD-binding subunit
LKFPRFGYMAPTTLDDALVALESDEDARPLAGGQSLLPLMAFRLSRPSLLVDLANIDALGRIEQHDGTVSIGAMVRQADCERSEEVKGALPLLAEATRYLAHPAIRTRGTVGGSLAHADPAAELPVVMVALDATMHVRSTSGARAIPARDFFRGHFTTALDTGEVLTRVDVPVSDLQWGFYEVARRHADFAIAIAAVGLHLDDGECQQARVVIGGVEDRPTRATEAEEALVGVAVEGDVAARAAEAAVRDVTPVSDVHGSSRYRRQVAAVVIRRAIERAAGGQS